MLQVEVACTASAQRLALHAVLLNSFVCVKRYVQSEALRAYNGKCACSAGPYIRC
jgi:hypothetical protein